MAHGVKAIETIYKGFRMRSRLEARWACFLDALAVPWEYEPEGFELPTGGRYLPDFWLPRQSAFFEVKRGDDVLEDSDGQRIREFGAAQPHPILVALGDPGGERTAAMPAESVLSWTDYEGAEHVDRQPVWRRGQWVQCPECGALGVSSELLSCACLGPAGYLGSAPQWQVLEAKRVARQARFEYGEHGAQPVRPRPAPVGMTPIYLAGKFPASNYEDTCEACDGRPYPFRCPLGRMCPKWHWRAEMWRQDRSGKETVFYGNGVFDGFSYVGPDLGANSNHGLWDHDTPKRCFDEIWRCDAYGAFFAWIHREDVAGTLVELGYAKALNIPVFVAFDSTYPGRLSDQLWFAKDMADAWCCVPTPACAWDRFLDWWACRTDEQRH